MDKTTIKTVLLTIVLLFIGLFLYGKFIGPVNISIGQNPNRTFDVTGSGTATVVPNSFTTTFTVSETGTTQKDAQDKGNTKQNKVLEILNNLGFDKKDIQTANYSIDPTYDYANGQNKVTGYSIDISTTVKSKDKTKIEKAIDQIASLGVNVQGVNLDTADDTLAKDESRTKAVEDAKAKAESLAKAAGFRLGKIASIREDDAAPGPIRMLDAAGSVSNKTTIEPGSNEVSATVVVTYYILD